ncbi:MAG: class I SAM-dependent methyltransferase [Candidatus Heimdallarchaeota archaeon]|nr:class I SAM-dependent methyltransferase [Candidatus Heimdallarchaeota archaeon]
MKNKTEVKEKPKYGNWMPKKFIFIGLLFSLGFTLIAIFVPILGIRIMAAMLALFCGVNSIYALYAYYMFSYTGGNLQEQIHNQLIKKLLWDGHGKCLEIGCGSASIAIKLAKKIPTASIVASDYWGKTPFEYNEKQCQANARIEGVADKIEFQFADATCLPFEDESFDAVISNLTFHEVRRFSGKDRYKLLLEALRVLKKGGYFAFQDVFLVKFAFGGFEHLEESIKVQVQELYWEDSFKSLQIPHWLDNVIMLKGLGIFYGKK